ncbi:hypothetical protein [Vibrio sp. MA40-2]|uniref:hypothetical protein n=1 Tax=Vibrio sp. MA40-2 TaxID=3391828 RepID=UPI0039A6F2A0
MKRSKKINACIYKLLIEKKMDGFSVIDARNVAQLFDESPKDANEIRKIVYRQIRLFEINGWLRSEGDRKDKRYFKTELFNSLSFEPKKKRFTKVTTKKISSDKPINDYSELVIERKRIKGKLVVTLSEIEKYQVLKEQYPEQVQLLNNLHAEASDQAAIFMGNIDAITKMLNSLNCGSSAC